MWIWSTPPLGFVVGLELAEWQDWLISHNQPCSQLFPGSPGSLEQSRLIPVLVCTERNAFAPSTPASQYAAFCPPTTNPPVTVRIKRGQRRMRLQDAPVFSALSLIGVSERLRALAEWDWFFLLTSTLGFLSGLLIGGLVSGLLLARTLWHW